MKFAIFQAIPQLVCRKVLRAPQTSQTMMGSFIQNPCRQELWSWLTTLDSWFSGDFVSPKTRGRFLVPFLSIILFGCVALRRLEHENLFFGVLRAPPKDLSHDPSCFLLTRTLEAQHLLGTDRGPRTADGTKQCVVVWPNRRSSTGWLSGNGRREAWWRKGYHRFLFGVWYVQ